MIPNVFRLESSSGDGKISWKIPLIEEAIAERNRIRFSDGEAGVFAEPHLLAVNTEGDMILRVYRIDEKEGWVDYRLAGLKDLEVQDECFDAPRPGYDPLSTGLLWVIFRL